MAKVKAKRRRAPSRKQSSRHSKRVRKKRSAASKAAATQRSPARSRPLRKPSAQRLGRNRQPQHWTERIEEVVLEPLDLDIAVAEPPKDRNPDHLMPSFREKLMAALDALAVAGTPFKFDEGFRTVDRQQWLYGQGRPDAKPYGRPGKKVTDRDGVKRLSNHQGTGMPGAGRAADCYPTKDGQVDIPPVTDPVWEMYAAAVERQGLVAGLRWKEKDAPHCELP